MATSTAWKNDPASDKQIATIERELARRSLPQLGATAADRLAHFADLRDAAAAAGKSIRKGWASDMLSALFNAPFEQRTASANPVTEPGFYLHDGSVYRVVRTRDGQRMYANKLVIHPHVEDCAHDGDCDHGFSWDYTPGAFGVIDASMAMTADMAAQFGKLNDRCAYCGRKLSDAISQAYYMGDSCARKHAGIKRSHSKAAYEEARQIIAARASVTSAG